MLLYDAVKSIILLLIPSDLDLTFTIFDTVFVYADFVNIITLIATIYIGYVIFIRPIIWFLKKVIPGKMVKGE